MTAVLLTILFVILSAVGWVVLAVLLTIGMTRRLTVTTDIASAASVLLRPRSSVVVSVEQLVHQSGQLLVRTACPAQPPPLQRGRRQPNPAR